MPRIIFLLSLLGLLAIPRVAADTAPVAAKPLFRDPVFDGAADPVVIWNPQVRRWWMFYTNRRANVPGLSGVAWVHGTKVGIAESADRGANWSYVGTADIELPADLGGTEPTYWAPEVITAPDGTHHMFLTVVPGVFENWEHPRRIVHLTSTDLRKWTYASALNLASDRVIDAVVHPLPGGGWRLWYNNERDHKSIYYADSPDLNTWTDHGKCAGVGERPGEGPYVFRWKGAYWMLVDLWKGLGVYRSDDLLHWTAQPDNLLGTPGTGTDDGVNGGHPGVVVSGERAYLFYFTHPGRAGTIKPEDKDSLDLRRSSIQVTELTEQDGRLECDRNRPVPIKLEAPAYRPPPPRPFGPVKRTDLRARDGCVYPDPATHSYLLYFASRGPNGRAAVAAYTSKDLETWTGPTTVFERPAEWWADRGLWAPEMHSYQGKFYLFLTFDSTHQFPEQWRDWLPRVKRGSQVLVADSPMGPFVPFANKPTLPEDMMTLDGTLWVENGVPYMVFCHEWVQIKDGTVEMVRLKDDLSATVGEPVRLFHGSDAPWSKKSEQYGCHVTDGPWLHRTKSGKLLLLWSSGSERGYAVGVATSSSGKLAGPWVQAPRALFDADGGHPMLFRRFDGQLMLALHQPNKTPHEREVFLELEELADTLVLKAK